MKLAQWVGVLFLFSVAGVLGGDGSWQTDGHNYNLKNKLVFGKGGARKVQRKVMNNIKQSSSYKQFGEFAGGIDKRVYQPNKTVLSK